MDSFPRVEKAPAQAWRGTPTSAVVAAHNPIRSWDDLQALLAGRGASVDVTPISDTPIVGDTTTLSSGGNKVEFSSWCNARVRGLVSAETFAIGSFLHSEPPNSLLNKELTSGSLVWVPPGAEREGTYAKTIEGAFLHVPANRFERLLEARGFTCGAARFLDQDQVGLPDKLARLLVTSNTRTRTLLLQHAEEPIPDRAFDFAFQHLLDNFLDFASLAFDTQYEAHDVFFDHAQLVKRVEDLLADHPGEIHTVNSICDHLRVQRRTLQRAFAGILGVTPHVYLRNWRLMRAHQDLVNGHSKNVTEAAMDWGFFDLGRFAGYYNHLFGERPSDTLRNAGIAV